MGEQQVSEHSTPPQISPQPPDPPHDCSTGSWAGDSEYLTFIEVHDTGKTKVWDVLSKSGGYRLAQVRWYGPWRQYTFRPEPNTIWNTACMETVTTFITLKMNERRVKT